MVSAHDDHATSLSAPQVGCEASRPPPFPLPWLPRPCPETPGKVLEQGWWGWQPLASLEEGGAVGGAGAAGFFGLLSCKSESSSDPSEDKRSEVSPGQPRAGQLPP